MLKAFFRTLFRFSRSHFLYGFNGALGLLRIVFWSLSLWHTRFHGIVPSQALFPATAL